MALDGGFFSPFTSKVNVCAGMLLLELLRLLKIIEFYKEL